MHAWSTIQVCDWICSPGDLICRGRKQKHQGNRLLSNAWQNRIRQFSRLVVYLSIERGFHAKEVDCLVSKLVNGVRWLGVFANDELPDVTREKRL